MRPPLDAGRPRSPALWVLLVVLAGCEDHRSANADANANVPAPVPVPVPVPVPDSGLVLLDAGHAVSPRPVCRVMASESGPSPSADATGWLDVAADASFTVRTLETGRELRFEGPGRVRACADDVALVGEGSAIGMPGSGEAPGAEQWVATACGVARWASGVHRFTGARDACRLHSSLGAVHLYVASDVIATEVAVDGGAPPRDADSDSGAPGRKAPWRRIDGRHAFVLQPAIPGPHAFDGAAGVKTALLACEHAADAVQKVAAAMLPDAAATDAGASIGALAEGSVVARGVARAACAVAAVRVALAGSKPVDEARLAAASARWRGGP